MFIHTLHWNKRKSNYLWLWTYGVTYFLTVTICSDFSLYFHIGRSIIWWNAMEKYFGEINIGDLDEMK